MILRPIVSILLLAPLAAASFLAAPSRLLADKLALPKYVKVPHDAPVETSDETPLIRARALQTIDEACEALQAAILVLESRRDTCTCVPSNDATEFRVNCAVCENVQAFDVDVAFTQRTEQLFYLYQSFDTYSEYAVAEETTSIFYTGADRTVESVSQTTFFERGTGISLACEVVLDGLECPCTYETCVVNGSPFRGSRVECPSFTWSECDGNRDEIIIGVEDIEFDICPCLFETPDPEVCNGGTFVPFPTLSPFPTFSPVVLPPSTAEPTSGTPPIVQAGVIPCATNSDCLSFTDYCSQGFCAPRQADGELCGRDEFGSPDFFACESFSCGRASGSPESPLICCPGVDEIVMAVQNYLTGEMQAAYPDTFLRLELQQVPSERRRLSIALELNGTAYFSGTEAPSNVTATQSAVLQDPQALEDYLNENISVDDDAIVVESVEVMIMATEEPTMAPSTASPSTDSPSAAPTNSTPTEEPTISAAFTYENGWGATPLDVQWASMISKPEDSTRRMIMEVIVAVRAPLFVGLVAQWWVTKGHSHAHPILIHNPQSASPSYYVSPSPSMVLKLGGGQAKV
eukprot:scaffold683_cov164-Amphora_coffeaeformis.AAC.2